MGVDADDLGGIKEYVAKQHDQEKWKMAQEIQKLKLSLQEETTRANLLQERLELPKVTNVRETMQPLEEVERRLRSAIQHHQSDLWAAQLETHKCQRARLKDQAQAAEARAHGQDIDAVTRQLEERVRELNESKQMYAALEARMRALPDPEEAQARVAELSKQCLALDEQLQEQKAMVQRVESREAAAEQEIARLRQERDALAQAARASGDAALVQHEAVISDLEARIRSLEGEANAFGAREQGWREQVRDLEEKLKLATAHEQEMIKLKKRYEAQIGQTRTKSIVGAGVGADERKAFEQEQAEVANTKRMLQQQVDEYAQAFRALGDEKAALVAEREQLKRLPPPAGPARPPDKGQLDAQKAEILEDIAQLKRVRESLDREKLEVANDVAKLRKIEQSLRTEKADIAEDIKKLQELRHTLERERMEVAQDVANLRQVEQSLQADRDDVADDIQKLKQIAANLARKSKQQEAALQHGAPLPSAGFDEDQLRKQQEELRRGQEALQAEKRRMLAVVETVEKEQNSLRAARAALQKERQESEAGGRDRQGPCTACPSLRAENERLQKELEELERGIEERTRMLREETQALIQSTETSLKTRLEDLEVDARQIEQEKRALARAQAMLEEEKGDLRQMRKNLSLLETQRFFVLRDAVPPLEHEPKGAVRLPRLEELPRRGRGSVTRLAPLPAPQPAQPEEGGEALYKRQVISLGYLVDLKLRFQQVDTDSAGLLDFAKLKGFCVKRGITNLSDHELRGMIEQVDIDDRGGVDFWGFTAIQVFLGLQLGARGVDLPGWLGFMTQTQHFLPKLPPAPSPTAALNVTAPLPPASYPGPGKAGGTASPEPLSQSLPLDGPAVATLKGVPPRPVPGPAWAKRTASVSFRKSPPRAPGQGAASPGAVLQ